MTVFFHYALHGFSNVYLVGNDETKEALIIDPAAFTLGLLDFIEAKGYTINTVLLTHNHSHHVDGLKTLLKIYDATVYSSNTFIDKIPCRVIEDSEKFMVCGMWIEALSVPGHSQDSIVYCIDKLIFTGDTLYAGLIGNTNSLYGNKLLREQIQKKLLSKDEDCLLLPGHGPPSTIAAEKRFNIAFPLKEKTNGNILLL